ncbi:MAG: sigma-70 family RNA polymerase sigma factor, partial [Candidatus Omnitrophica bacterium]|nr:sigma-70 family RNA polymerase sigma factor [Candidatus Omnitrophota bacterium]
MVSFDELFRSFSNKVYHLALGISKNEADAKDIVQNTFLKVMQHIGSFRDEAKISTWIYKIAYNEALMLLRRKHKFVAVEGLDDRQVSVPAGFSVNWPQLPDASLLEKELQQRLSGAIERLPILYRMPLLLHAVEGESIQATAEVLDVSESAVKTRLHRATGYLRDEIAAYLQDGGVKIGSGEDSRCSCWVDFVYDYATGTLDAANRQLFMEHIGDCPPCKDFLREYQQAIRVTGALRCADIPPALQEKI